MNSKVCLSLCIRLREAAAVPIIVVWYGKWGKLTQYLRQLIYSVDLWRPMREYWHTRSCREFDQRSRGSIDKLKLVRTLLDRSELAHRDD